MPRRAGQPHIARSQQWMKIIGVFLVILLIGGWFYWITNTSQYIQNFTLTTSSPEDTELVERYVSDYLETPLWFGITKRKHRSLLDMKRLEDDLIRLFPIFKDAKVGVFDNHLLVELTNRTPTALWCNSTKTAEEKCWFIDGELIMFRKAPSFSDGVYIKYSSLIHNAPAVGEPILTESLRSFVVGLLEQIESYSLEPTNIVIETEDRIAVYIQKIKEFKVPGHAKIIVSTKQDVTAISERLTLLLASPEFIEEIESHAELFEYADLRFPGRLVYKLADEE